MMKVLDRAQRGKKLQSSPAKISNEVLKQTMGPCHPLFWGSNSQEGTHQQTQIKAGGRDLVPLSEIFCSLEGGSAQSALVQEMLKAAFQVHSALAQKRFARLALDGTSGAMKSFAQRGAQSFLATPGSVGIPDYRN